MRVKMKRVLSLFLALLLMTAVFNGLTASAEDTVDRGSRLYRGTFHYTGNEDTFYYSDGYFSESGESENEHLRTFSAGLAFSILGTAPQDVLDLLTDIGMEPDSIVMEDMVTGTPDTIGTVIAKKSLEDMPLLAVVIRGSDYAGEWANNVQAGTEGDASGFAAAAAKVTERIEAYLEDNDIDQAKIWVCGYSRAGGVANLVGRALNEDPASFHTDKDNIYVYTYEAPRCSADDTVYGNIHNIADVRDLVPHFYPESWGLYLNGVTESIGDPEETMMARCFHVATEGYIKEMNERPKAAFLDQFETFASSAVSRESYAADSERYLSNVLNICLSKDREDRQELLSYLSKIGELLEEYPYLDMLIANLLANPTSANNINFVSNLLSDFMDEARETENPPLSDEEYASLKEAVKPLVTLALTLADVDLQYKEKKGGKTTYYNLYHMVTLFSNIMDFIDPHINVNVFEKLKEQDSYYTLGVRIKPGSVYVGEDCYTYAEYGSTLIDLARSIGFTEEDIEVLSNGYDVRVETVMTEIPDPSQELYLSASGILDKSMKMYSFYEASFVKTIGYRSYPSKGFKLKENHLSITLPKELGDTASRLAVVRVTENGAEKRNISIRTTAAGEAELRFIGDIAGVYASAYDDNPVYRCADVDRDDQITSLDVTHIQRRLANLEFFGAYQNKAADVDGDGEVSILDVSWVQRYLAFIEVPFGIGEQFGIS